MGIEMAAGEDRICKVIDSGLVGRTDFEIIKQDKKMPKSLSTLRLEGSPTQSRKSPSIQRVLRELITGMGARNAVGASGFGFLLLLFLSLSFSLSLCLQSHLRSLSLSISLHDECQEYGPGWVFETQVEPWNTKSPGGEVETL